MTSVPAISTAAFDGYPMEVALDVIAAVGVRFVEPAYIKGYTAFDEDSFSAGSAARLARMLAERSLVVRSVSAHMDLSAPGAGTMLTRRIAFAQAIGAKVLITNCGPAVDRSEILAVLDAAAIELDAADVTLALENPGHGSGDLIGRAVDGVQVVTALDAPRIGLNVDVGNLLTYDTATPLDIALGTALPHSVHAHLKDVAAVGPDWRFVPLGEGMVDWRAVAASIVKLAPDLLVAIELPLRLDRPGRGDPRRSVYSVPLPIIQAAIDRSLATWNGFIGGSH